MQFYFAQNWDDNPQTVDTSMHWSASPRSFSDSVQLESHSNRTSVHDLVIESNTDERNVKLSIHLL